MAAIGQAFVASLIAVAAMSPMAVFWTSFDFLITYLSTALDSKSSTVRVQYCISRILLPQYGQLTVYQVTTFIFQIYTVPEDLKYVLFNDKTDEIDLMSI